MTRPRPDIESDFADVADMAQCADMLLEMFFKELRNAADGNVPAKAVVAHLTYWEKAASFPVLHTKLMAEKLQKTYLSE